MKNITYLTILFIFICYSNNSIAKNETSLPEFECTAIEKKKVSQVSELLGNNKYPSISLRKKSSGDWLLNIQNKKIVLTSNLVLKNSNVISNKAIY